MKCENYSNLIQDFVENELDTQTADEVSMHIFSCLRCEQEFELLTEEKELYAQFLFEIEPPKNLSARFRARLENESETVTAPILPEISFGERLANLFSLKKPLPVLSALSLLLVFGGVLSVKKSLDENAQLEMTGVAKTNGETLVNTPREELATNLPRIAVPRQFEKASLPISDLTIRKNEKNRQVTGSSQEKNATPRNAVRRNEKNNKSVITKPPVLSEEEKSRFHELQAFERDAARQIEKIEMLLRSFRNARYSEETAQYDVSFEKEQARKLLGANIKLRAQADFYGDFLTGEILDKVQTYLLDIANLENNPSTEAVLDIKQRVRNQNLIASLQSF